MCTKLHASSGRLHTAAVLMLTNASPVCPPSSTCAVCCVTMLLLLLVLPPPVRLVSDGGCSSVSVKPASGIGESMLLAAVRVYEEGEADGRWGSREGGVRRSMRFE